MSRKQYTYHYIYKTTNLINGKFYVGMHSTFDLNDGYLGSGKALWYAFKKYGKENFKKEILEFLPDRKSLIDREKEIVTKDLINETECYNMLIGGQGGPTFEGKTHTIENKEKFRKFQTGRKLSKETCKKISEANKKRKLSDETKKKLSDKLKEYHRNHTATDEQKQKLSEATKKGMTSEVRKKISEKAKERERQKREERERQNNIAG